VSNVAYAPRIARATSTMPIDEAPILGLVANIGSATQPEARAGLPGNRSDPMVWLLVFLTVAFVGEVASRRMRGAS
jgi:hypothetical protein